MGVVVVEVEDGALMDVGAVTPEVLLSGTEVPASWIDKFEIDSELTNNKLKHLHCLILCIL